MRKTIRDLVLILIILLLGLPSGSIAATVPDYSITYTVNVQEDGSALWQIEYRTLLATESDIAAFETYTRDLPSMYLPEVKELMEQSAAQASVAVARPMVISTMTGNAAVQTSPTGRYGVVIYSFTWTAFAGPDGDLAVGDAFTGGLYLAKDSTLIVRYPAGWSVARAEPVPDDQRDGLIWYGQRSFSPGAPAITLRKPAFPLVPVIILLFILSLAGAGIMVYRKRKDRKVPEEPGEPEGPAVPLTETEAANLEERILHLLGASGGEMYQSEIVRALGIPKSTVSSSIGSLHAKGMIVKVKKGRENLIRRARE